MIEKLLNKFYFLTKLSTSLILFIIIIFFGYLFSRAYILKSGNEQSFLINEQINELFVSVKHNSESLKNINNKIISSEESLKKIQLKIDQQSNTDVLLDQINLLLKANEEINKEINSLNKKIGDSKINIQSNKENNSQSNKKNNSSKESFYSLINLIKLKYENGSDVKKELLLLQGYLNNSQDSYLEKMFILSDKKFIGVENLQNEFDILMKEYLKEYYNKNNNLFYSYLSRFYSIEPNSKSYFKNDMLKNFSIIKEKLSQKDIKSSLNHLLKIEKSETYFDNWIQEAKNYILFNNNLIFIQDNK